VQGLVFVAHPLYMHNSPNNLYGVVLLPTDHKIKESCTLRELQLDNMPPGGSPAQRFVGGGRCAGGGVCNPVCDNVEFCLRETYCCTE
jgi:hypothetical protein